jgi:hypothetical protein
VACDQQPDSQTSGRAVSPRATNRDAVECNVQSVGIADDTAITAQVRPRCWRSRASVVAKISVETGQPLLAGNVECGAADRVKSRPASRREACRRRNDDQVGRSAAELAGLCAMPAATPRPRRGRPGHCDLDDYSGWLAEHAAREAPQHAHRMLTPAQAGLLLPIEHQL